ncbi:hypothetical protein G7Z17_g12625 [Cylindrodendrum hubeiense]|uniref:C3H1-type domain-containing protein n=1 Tax=Cylindrodendrum hubeiense TaxID=595255 RepID=A0A9P5H1K6_9HYPO|nr:hypothetical protein G7Z17_g12625 [Cylindrodendrum hubeiense]
MDPICRIVLSKSTSAAPAPTPSSPQSPSSPPSFASLSLSSKDNSPEPNTQRLADASHAMEHHQSPSQTNIRARASWIYANSQKDAQQGQQLYRAAAPRGATSPNWRVPQVDVGVWGHTTQANYTLGSFSPPRIEPTLGGLGGYAYCLDRGNGQYTRLIPADVLPPMNEIPARQPGPPGMVILPDLHVAPPQGVAPLNKPVTMKHQIDQIVATSPAVAKKPKVYCDKWIHDGQCAFAQQGCKFKHEMPFDKATQHSLGLFQGLPGWWKRLQVELRKQEEDRRKEIEELFSTTPISPAALADQAAVDRHSGAFMDQPGWQNNTAGNMQPRVPPELNLKNLNKRHAVGSVWSPISQQHKTRQSTALVNNPSRRNTWAPRGGNYPSHPPSNKAI